MEDDWDLQAVVRGCTTVTGSSTTSTSTSTSTTTNMDHPLFCFPPLNIEDEQLFGFPDLFETRDALEELEQFYKPFFPNPQSISTSTSPVSALGGFKEQQQPQKQSLAAASSTQAQTPRTKRRKNLQKRVVCQVPAEGLSSDMWAWRKYGQKPIKGSPYPRGYYRCSSSKACLARKQVERSSSDPAMFVVTYTADHNHPIPTHRNSLAGSTRHNKYSTPQPANAGDHPDTPTSTSRPSYPSSPISSTGLSPTTPLTVSMEEEILQEIKQEIKEEEEEEIVAEDDEEDDQLLISDVVTTDDLFMSLEELCGSTSMSTTTTTRSSSAAGPAFDDCFPDHFRTSLPHSWFSNNAATAGSGS